MVHFLYPQFRGNPADREHRLVFNGPDQPADAPAPVEKTDAAPVSAESAEPAAVLEKKDAAVDATQKEVAATPAPEGVVTPLVVDGENGKQVGVKIAEGLPGNEGKTKADFDKAQPKKGEAQTAAADKTKEGRADSAKEAAEPVVAEVTNEQMESAAYQDMGLDGIPKKDVAITLSPDRRSGEMFHRDGTSLGTVEFGVDGKVSSAALNVEAIATLKQKTEAKDKADDAAKEKGEKVSADPEMDKLGKQVDEGVRDLEKAKTPAEALAALGKILSAIIEMVKRTLGIQTEADKQEKSEGKGKEAAADTSTDDGLRKELKDRGATSIEDQREELADLRDQAQEKVEKNKEEISELDTEIDGLQTKKESVDDQVQALKKQLIDAEQEGKSEEDLGKMKTDLQKLERKAERIQKKIDKALDRRRELVDQNKKLEASIAAIDKLESRLDTLESTFDKIEQALQKKFDVTVKIERDDGKTIFNVTTLGEGTPVWFKEFVEEHDENENPGDGYQIDPTNAELLSKMPESKPLDTTEEPAEDSREDAKEDATEDQPAEPALGEAEASPEDAEAIGKSLDRIKGLVDIGDITNIDQDIAEVNADLAALREKGGSTASMVDGLVPSGITERGLDNVLSYEGGKLTFTPPTEQPATPSDTPAEQPESTPAPTEVADTAEPGNTETFDEVSPEDAQAIDTAVNRLDAIKGMIDIGDITNIDQDIASINSELTDISTEKPYTSSYMESAMDSKLSSLDLGDKVSYENGTLAMIPQPEQAPTEDPTKPEASQDVADSAPAEDAAPANESGPDKIKLQKWAENIQNKANALGIDVSISVREDGWMEITANNDGAKAKFEAIQTAADNRGIEHDDIGEGVMAVRVTAHEADQGYFGSLPRVLAKVEGDDSAFKS